MTATPERSDDFDIYELFHHHIAYEIRLHHALAENMLVPFHYHGIADTPAKTYRGCSIIRPTGKERSMAMPSSMTTILKRRDGVPARFSSPTKRATIFPKAPNTKTGSSRPTASAG
jgi:superfamily II DNA or RNA helicase